MKNVLEIKGISVEYSLTYSPGPVIILLNGFRMPLSSWDQVTDGLCSFGSVLCYNRFGVGKTSSGNSPHTGSRSVELLRSLLKALDLKSPYILVAHSFGGLIANLYTRLYPDDIAGILFVDATHPDEKAAQEQFRPPLGLKMFSEGLKGVEKLFDKYKYSEDETYPETFTEIKNHPFFPAIPITVLSGTKKLPFVPEGSFLVHLKYQEKLLELSPRSRMILSANSGHFPQITEPELVIKAAKALVEATGYSFQSKT
ncbi:alpha/beta fold hydrolase [Desertivirga brevis]|uniref:alpha/beta fold hydrolase n=1 Tax=Desertivirga brevis TaxID=2810310 RepID=UPI001A95A165|nr:alpha/beta fold hydrolase [Pedobacter sp. SYSU D00873]